jgi:DNA-binding CsgD family transcriptional regulator
MGKSQLLRREDLRSVYRLLGECCELGADPIAWRRHMVAGLRLLLDAQVAIYQELQPAAPPGPRGWLVPLLTIDMGWPAESDRRVLADFWARNEFELCPWFSRRNFQRVFHPPRRLAAFSLSRLIATDDWHGCEFFNDYVRRGHLDDMVLATYDNGNGATHGLVLHRALGEQPFETRQRRLLALFFAEHSQLLGTRLAGRDALSVVEFPQRLRQVLTCLMEGDGEREIALRLGISQHTVHFHIKELFRRFGVSGRGRLMAAARPFWPALEAQRRAPPD